MAKTLHPKILQLRNSIGYKPMYEFWPTRKKYEEVSPEKRKLQTTESTREIKQYFAIWGVPDDYGTEPMPGCFKQSINERGPGTNATNKIVVLNQHNQRSPLCLPSVLKEDDIGLYSEYTPDEDIEENDILVKRVKKGTINGGSYGFNYNWDEMRYDEKKDVIRMYDTILFEGSPVTIASQGGTYVVRGKDGNIFDEDLERETEEFIRTVPKKYHLELRSLISRHISLVNSQPKQSLGKNNRSKKGNIDFEFLASNLNF